MTDYAELERLDAAATPGPWSHFAFVHDTDAAEDMTGIWAGAAPILNWGATPPDAELAANVNLIVAMRNALPALLAERAEMLALLEKLEWTGAVGDSPESEVGCAICGRFENGIDGGHAPDCRLAALLGRLGA